MNHHVNREHCACDICRKGRQILEIIGKLPPDDYDVLYTFYEEYLDVADESDYYKMKYIELRKSVVNLVSDNRLKRFCEGDKCKEYKTAQVVKKLDKV